MSAENQSSELPNVTDSIPNEYKSPLVYNPDGTYTRLIVLPSAPADPNPSTTSNVRSKDIPLNPEYQTMVRIYLPEIVFDPSRPKKEKLPIIFYYHGGGFIFFSATSSIFHDFCSNMALTLMAIVVSVEYRLAPEHRLPAAYDDSVEALHWIKTTQEEWISQFADLTRCYLMGSSAGGNIAYEVGFRACEAALDLEPLKIRGLVLHHPFFGGLDKTESELKLDKDPFLPLEAINNMWDYALPEGAGRDHEYCDPRKEGESGKWEVIRVMGCRILMAGCYGDPLIDRQKILTKLFEVKGIMTETYYGDGHHGLEIIQTEKAQDLFKVLASFMSV